MQKFDPNNCFQEKSLFFCPKIGKNHDYIIEPWNPFVSQIPENKCYLGFPNSGIVLTTFTQTFNSAIWQTLLTFATRVSNSVIGLTTFTQTF
jgi:hypothetical protein